MRSNTVLQDMQRMLKDTTFTDMVFVCGQEEEEEEVRACKMLVASRSPVLECMLLTSGMAESKLDRVRLVDIDPATMRICLEFFYTDSVKDTSWSSFLLAMKVVKAANFFLLERLMKLAITYMTSSVLSFDHAVNEDFITAYNLGASLHPPIKDMENVLSICSNHIHDFMESESQLNDICLVYKNLSELALAHLIHTTKQLYDNGSLSEYFSFLHVVRWTAYRLAMAVPAVDRDELAKALDRCLPWTLEELSRVTNVELDDVNIFSFMKLIADPLAELLQRVPLHFAKIPTYILCKIIEPLNLVPPSTLFTAYRLQAFSRPDLRWDQFSHGKNYNIKGDDMTIISCNRQIFQGFAMCSTYLSAKNVSCFDWEIVMLRPCKMLRIGFCLCNPSFTASDCNDQVLGDKEGSWAVGGDGFLHYTSLDSEKYSIPYADSFYGISKATVHLDIVNRRCSFAVNGKTAKLAWENLPIGNHAVYPAISLQKPGKAQVQMVYQGWMSHPSKRMCFAS